MPERQFDPALAEKLYAMPYPALGAVSGMVRICNAAAAGLFGFPAAGPTPPRPAADFLSPPAARFYQTQMERGYQVGHTQSEWMDRGYHVEIQNQPGGVSLIFVPRLRLDGDHMPQLMLRLDSHIRKQLTPLLAALGQMAPASDEKNAPYLAEARRSVFSLLRMSNNLRDSAKCFDRLDFFDPELIELGRFCREIIQSAGLAAGFSGVKMAFSCSAEPLVAAVDPVKLERILFNLLSNAVCSSKEGGAVSVSVSLSEPGGSIILRVRDEGGGMDAGQLDGIFEKYRHFSANDPSPGLGLPLAAAYTEQHGGAIFLESKKGVGTTVTVTLPYSTEGDPPLGAPPPDYTGEIPHFLVELSDLPGTAPLYGKQTDLDALLEKYV